MREAFSSIQTTFEKQIAQTSGKVLRDMVNKTLGQLSTEYNNFFEVLYDDVLNAGNLANTDEIPKIFSNPGVKAPVWAAVSDRWFQQKSRNQDPRSLEFYHGLTYGIINKLGKLTKKGRLKPRGSGATKIGVSFDQFIQSLTFDGKVNVEEFFGPLQVAFSFITADGRKSGLKSLDDNELELIYKNKNDEKGIFLVGTVLTAKISAFTKINSINTEKALVAYMMQMTSGGNDKQWLKITGRNSEYTRAILLPLVSYYTDYYFKILLSNNLR